MYGITIKIKFLSYLISLIRAVTGNNQQTRTFSGSFFAMCFAFYYVISFRNSVYPFEKVLRHCTMHYACGLPHQSIWVKLRSLYCRVIGIFFAIFKAQNTKRRFDKRNTYKQNVFCYCSYVVVVVDAAFSATVQSCYGVKRSLLLRLPFL